MCADEFLFGSQESLISGSVARWDHSVRTVFDLKPRWTLQPAPISSQRWYNCQGRMGQGHRPLSSLVSSFSHCTYSLPLCAGWLYFPPSLSHYPPPTAGQFVHPAWLPPPLLLRYLAPRLHFNGRYWLEKFQDLFAIPQKSPLPFPATFNLITGFLQLFRGGWSQEDNSRPSGFTNTLPMVIWFTRGAASCLLQHQVPARWIRVYQLLEPWLVKKSSKLLKTTVLYQDPGWFFFFRIFVFLSQHLILFVIFCKAKGQNQSSHLLSQKDAPDSSSYLLSGINDTNICQLS